MYGDAIGDDPAETIGPSKSARARAPALSRSLDKYDFARERGQRKKDRTLDSPTCSRRALPSVYRASAMYPAARRSYVFYGNPAISARSPAHQTVSEERNVPLARDLSSHNHRSPADSTRNGATSVVSYICINARPRRHEFSRQVITLPTRTYSIVRSILLILPVRRDVRRFVMT